MSAKKKERHVGYISRDDIPWVSFSPTKLWLGAEPPSKVVGDNYTVHIEKEKIVYLLGAIESMQNIPPGECIPVNVTIEEV